MHKKRKRKISTSKKRERKKKSELPIERTKAHNSIEGTRSLSNQFQSFRDSVLNVRTRGEKEAEKRERKKRATHD